MADEKNAPVLGKDIPLKTIDKELCRVISFTPFGKVKDGKVESMSTSTPYASLLIECPKLKEKATLWVTNATDFRNLWSAYHERETKPSEEVLICWSNNLYKIKALKIASVFLPHLVVMVFPKNAYELMADSKLRPELQGETRAKATMPIDQWKPEIME